MGIVRLFVMFLLLFMVSPVYAAVDVQEDSVSTNLMAEHLNFTGNVDVSSSGNTATVQIGGETQTRAIRFGPGDFCLDGPYAFTESTGLEIDNNLVSMVWSWGESTAAQVTFKIPADYASGGAFYALCDRSSSAGVRIDYQVFYNQAGYPWDSAAVNMAPVALSNTAGSPELVTLALTLDNNNLGAGAYCTFETWRSNVASYGVSDLEIYYVEFTYTSSEQ